MIKTIKLLKKYKNNLSKQQVSTLKGQALSGDIEGAKRGLFKLLKKKGIVK